MKTTLEVKNTNQILTKGKTVVRIVTRMNHEVIMIRDNLKDPRKATAIATNLLTNMVAGQTKMLDMTSINKILINNIITISNSTKAQIVMRAINMISTSSTNRLIIKTTRQLLHIPTISINTKQWGTLSNSTHSNSRIQINRMPISIMVSTQATISTIKIDRCSLNLQEIKHGLCKT